eukprot:311266_1
MLLQILVLVILVYYNDGSLISQLLERQKKVCELASKGMCYEEIMQHLQFEQGYLDLLISNGCSDQVKKCDYKKKIEQSNDKLNSLIGELKSCKENLRSTLESNAILKQRNEQLNEKIKSFQSEIISCENDLQSVKTSNTVLIQQMEQLKQIEHSVVKDLKSSKEIDEVHEFMEKSETVLKMESVDEEKIDENAAN